jgi:peptidoglycan-associated lipoprotein
MRRERIGSKGSSTGSETSTLHAVALWIVVVAALVTTGCGGKKPPVARPTQPPPPIAATSEAPVAPARPPAPPETVAESNPIVPREPIRDEALSSASLDELNRTSPLKPVFFELDSSDVSAEGQRVLDANAAILKKYPGWTITIEGHCDERGTAEYNLALGERRALAARAYLVSLGLPGDRLRTVSYGKEFPFDPGRTETAFAKNRRAHFVITAK